MQVAGCGNGKCSLKPPFNLDNSIIESVPIPRHLQVLQGRALESPLGQRGDVVVIQQEAAEGGAPVHRRERGQAVLLEGS